MPTIKRVSQQLAFESVLDEFCRDTADDRRVSSGIRRHRMRDLVVRRQCGWEGVRAWIVSCGVEDLNLAILGALDLGEGQVEGLNPGGQVCVTKQAACAEELLLRLDGLAELFV